MQFETFHDIGEELKTIFSYIFGLYKNCEVKKYSNEKKELFETLFEMFATTARINLKVNLKREDINKVTSYYNEIKSLNL